MSAGERDCSTLLPAGAELGAVRIEGLFAPAAEPNQLGVISLGLAFLSAWPLADEARREAVLPETLRLVNELLAPGALSVTVARPRSVGSQIDSLDLIRGAEGPLDALYGELIGHGASGPIDGPPSLLAKLLAHELGLYHSVEADGTEALVATQAGSRSTAGVSTARYTDGQDETTSSGKSPIARHPVLPVDPKDIKTPLFPKTQHTKAQHQSATPKRPHAQ